MKSEYLLFQCIHTRKFVSALMCQRKTNKHVRVHAEHAYPLSLCTPPPPPSSPRRTPSSHPRSPFPQFCCFFGVEWVGGGLFFSLGFRLTVTCCNLAAAYLEAVDTFPDSANFSSIFFSETTSVRAFELCTDLWTFILVSVVMKCHSRVSAELEKKIQCWVFDCLKSFIFFYLTEERTCICGWHLWRFESELEQPVRLPAA